VNTYTTNGSIRLSYSHIPISNLVLFVVYSLIIRSTVRHTHILYVLQKLSLKIRTHFQHSIFCTIRASVTDERKLEFSPLQKEDKLKVHWGNVGFKNPHYYLGRILCIPSLIDIFVFIIQNNMRSDCMYDSFQSSLIYPSMARYYYYYNFITFTIRIVRRPPISFIPRLSFYVWK